MDAAPAMAYECHCGDQPPLDVAIADPLFRSASTPVPVPLSWSYFGSTLDANWANHQHNISTTCVSDAQAPEENPALGCDVAVPTGRSCVAPAPEITSPPTVLDRSYFCECWRLCRRVPGVEAQWDPPPPCFMATRCSTEESKAQVAFLRHCTALPTKAVVADFSVTLMNPCGWKFRYSYARQPESNESRKHLEKRNKNSTGRRQTAMFKRALKFLTSGSPCTLYDVRMQTSRDPSHGCGSHGSIRAANRTADYSTWRERQALIEAIDGTYRAQYSWSEKDNPSEPDSWSVSDPSEPDSASSDAKFSENCASNRPLPSDFGAGVPASGTVLEGQMSPSTPMPSADGADVRMTPSFAHLLRSEAKQQLKVQPPKSGRTATEVADVCKECVIHMAVSKLGCTEFPLGKPGDISTLFVKAVCGSNTGLAGLSLLPSRRDLDHSRETCKHDIRSRLSTQENAKYEQVRKNMHRTLAGHLKI